MTFVRLDSRARERLATLLDAPRGRRVGVLGLGIAGTAMAKHLAERGAQLVLADERTDLPTGDLPTAGVTLRLGKVDAQTFADAELLVLSPGADPRQPAVRAVLERGVPVCGELELCGRLPARVAAITGTNGKSTTTALLGALVQGCGARAFVGGNLGDPVLTWLDSGAAADIAVLELSSFQLETAYSFQCDVGVVLNVTPDHTDRYASVAEYAATKEHLVASVAPTGVAVLSRDDAVVRDMAPAARGRVYWLSTRGPVDEGAYLDGDRMVFAGSLRSCAPWPLAHPRLFGRHNRENALAALLAAVALGLGEHPKLLETYLAFAGLPHRLELVGEVAGVRYINDSKATNDDAAAVALEALAGPVILLLGGRDKGGGYDKVRARLAGRVRQVVAFGEAQPLIVEALRGAVPIQSTDSLASALTLAKSLARPGDAVLLSPACSSFDAFKNYKERGETFRRLVAALPRGGRS